MNNNILTADEISRVMKFHPFALPDKATEKPILTPLRYMNDEQAILLSYWCDHIPFVNAARNEWTIIREPDKIIVRHAKKLHSYHIDTDCGNVKIFNEARLSNLGTDVYAAQFYIEYNYAFPLKFGPGHWANGKTAIELGIAVPNRSIIDGLLYEKFGYDKEQVELWYHEKTKYYKVNFNDLEIFNREYMLLKNELKIAV